MAISILNFGRVNQVTIGTLVRIVAGIGRAQFDATVVRKLPLVGNDESIFSMARELGWSAEWVAAKRPQPTTAAGSVDSSGDIAAVLTGGGRVTPPPAAMAVGPVPGSSAVPAAC